MEQKVFYVVSALRTDSCPPGSLKRLNTEAEAIEHANYVIQRRRTVGAQEIGFYILKVSTYVGPVQPEIKTIKLKETRSVKKSIRKRSRK